MSRFVAINLAKLPPPDVVNVPDFEVLQTAGLNEFATRWPDFNALLESDPAIKLLEVNAWARALVLERINDAARAVMLPTATGADLDNLAALYGVERHVLDAGDPDAIPPLAATMESDVDFRKSVQLALEAFSTAGPQGAYIFHALRADPRVKNVAAYGPESGLVTPAQVKMVILSRDDDGAAPADLITIVDAALSHKDVRPLADQVFVESATIIDYTIDASLQVLPGPDLALVEANALEKVEAYVASRHLVGRKIDQFGIGAALSVEGVEDISITSPAADIEVDLTEAAFCSAINLTVEVMNV